MNPKQLCLVSFATIAASTQVVLAQSQSEEDELASTYGTVTIATGTKQPINKAPSTATVVTAADIIALGANDLTDVLESVAGLHVSHGALGNHPRYFIRGIASNFAPEVLILINGSKTNLETFGRDSFIYGHGFIHNISRIEIIRGPGSALYGADAFSGVVNIITKNADEIAGTEIGAQLGNLNTKETWVQHGGKFAGFNVAAYLAYAKSDGSKRTIDSDLQSLLDGFFQTHASNAPGKINAEFRAVDARLELDNENWKIHTGFQDRNVGTGGGIAESLDPAGRLRERRFNFSGEYQKTGFLPNFDILAKFEYYQLKTLTGDPQFLIFPKGAFSGTFPDGIVGNPGHSERAERFALVGAYTGWNSHKIRLGVGHEIEDLYATEEYKNFRLKIINGALTFVPLGSVVNATGNPDLIYLLPHKRNLSYAFLQDEWALAKDWALTAGVRYDRYSDFGSTTNPRLALVWDPKYNLTIKGIYGQAFRAPTFNDQYGVNNPVANGNRNVQPEKIRTTELAFIYQPTPKLQTSLTFFSYLQKNIIAFVPDSGAVGTKTAQNTGNQSGKGFELEATWNVERNLKLVGNISTQKSIHQDTGKDVGLAPERHIFVRADWQFRPNWELGVVVNNVASRKREADDTRPPIADYSTVDLTIQNKKLTKNFEVQATIKNLFNKDAREPTLSPGSIPYDLPLPERTFYLQFIYKF
jgi:iron complex outermembrane receptor protein